MKYVIIIRKLKALTIGELKMNRCEWCGSDELYIRYHDDEWGVPVHDDNKHFEFLVLESAQSGLSWLTILRKRENYRKAYDNFDPHKVAEYGEEKIQELLSDAGIIRNIRKIESSIVNAKKFVEIQKEFGSFDAYIWGFVNGRPVSNSYQSISEVPATSELSDRISSGLKKKGFKFLGSITVYSHIQATGIVNDHIDTCFRKNII
jgi:DNA-3-methyladenine glycosylase I